MTNFNINKLIERRTPRWGENVVSQADITIARKKMKLKSSNYCMSFVSTLWKGEVIMLCYNNIDKVITNAFCSQTLEDTDIDCLENIINKKIILDNPV